MPLCYKQNMISNDPSWKHDNQTMYRCGEDLSLLLAVGFFVMYSYP